MLENLKTSARMMASEISRFDVLFHKAKGRYYEGDVVTGEVVIELRDSIVIESKLILEWFTATKQYYCKECLAT